MIVLVDGDIVTYRSASSCEPTKAKPEREPLDIAIARCEDMMQRIMAETSANSHRAWIGGTSNYRYDIDPSYKANRKDIPKPLYLEDVREYLVTHWGAEISDGIETDDNLGIHQTDDTIIASIDKDLLQIKGKHYNFVKGIYYDISEHQGWVNFYHQLIMGDRSDNVKGFDGLMRQVVPKFLQHVIDKISECGSPREMYETVLEIYELGEEALHRNAQLLYIQRKHGDQWQVPVV